MDINEVIGEFIKTRFILTALPIFNRVNDSTKGEFFVLNFLSKIKRSVSPKEISDEMMVSTARIAVMLNDLEAKNHIIRVHSDKDKRKVEVLITCSGEQIIKDKIAEMRDIISCLFERLGAEDSAELVRIEKRMGQILKEIKMEKKLGNKI